MPARRMETNTSFLPSMTLRGGAFQRRLDLDLVHRDVAKHLVGHQRRHLVDSCRKLLVEVSFRRIRVELVLHQRVVDR